MFRPLPVVLLALALGCSSAAYWPDEIQGGRSALGTSIDRTLVVSLRPHDGHPDREDIFGIRFPETKDELGSGMTRLPSEVYRACVGQVGDCFFVTIDARPGGLLVLADPVPPEGITAPDVNRLKVLEKEVDGLLSGDPGSRDSMSVAGSGRPGSVRTGGIDRQTLETAKAIIEHFKCLAGR